MLCVEHHLHQGEDADGVGRDYPADYMRTQGHIEGEVDGDVDANDGQIHIAGVRGRQQVLVDNHGHRGQKHDDGRPSGEHRDAVEDEQVQACDRLGDADRQKIGTVLAQGVRRYRQRHVRACARSHHAQRRVAMQVDRRPHAQPADGESERRDEDDEDAGRQDGWLGVQWTERGFRDDEFRAVDEPGKLEGVHNSPNVDQPVDFNDF